MPIYILVTNYNYDNELYAFQSNNDFLNWYSENSDQVESLKHISVDRDILFIDPTNKHYAYVRYHDAVDPNKVYREILAYDPNTNHFDGSIAEYLVLHSHVIESVELIGTLKEY